MKWYWSKVSFLVALSLLFSLSEGHFFPIIGLRHVPVIDGIATAATPSPLDQIIQAAKQEGGVVIRTNADLALKEGSEKTINDGVNKMFGVNLKVRVQASLGYDQDAATIISELDSGRQPSWDAVIGTAPTLFRLKQRNAFESVDWPRFFPHITPKMIDKIIGSVILSVNWYVPYYNTRAISKDDLANLPKKWEDFLDPRWKGKLIHPLGTRQEVLVARVWGEEKTVEFARQLAKQELLIARFPEARSRLFAGERPVAYYGDYPIWHTEAEARGAPVQPIIGLDPQPTVYFMLGVTAKARNPNAAKLVLAYLVTPEAQQYIYSLVRYGSPFVPGSPIEKIQHEMEAKGARMVTFGDLEEDERRNRIFNKILGF